MKFFNRERTTASLPYHIIAEQGGVKDIVESCPNNRVARSKAERLAKAHPSITFRVRNHVEISDPITPSRRTRRFKS